MLAKFTAEIAERESKNAARAAGLIAIDFLIAWMSASVAPSNIERLDALAPAPAGDLRVADRPCVFEKELLSESALLRRQVELVLLKAGLSPILTKSPTGARPRRGARLMIRLRPDDQILLRERAAARGMPAATYVSVLTRSHLRSLAPLPAEELLALKRTIGELGSIGRNLNQIARAAN
jgi:hypothetical protein